MPWLAILAAAFAGFAAGAVWYGLLGARWLAAAGEGAAAMRASGSALPYVVAVAADLLTAALLAHVFAGAGVSGAGAGAVGGLGVGLGVAAPWIVTNYAFAGRPRALWWIDAGHAALAATAIGTVLGLML